MDALTLTEGAGAMGEFVGLGIAFSCCCGIRAETVENPAATSKTGYSSYQQLDGGAAAQKASA